MHLTIDYQLNQMTSWGLIQSDSFCDSTLLKLIYLWIPQQLDSSNLNYFAIRCKNWPAHWIVRCGVSGTRADGWRLCKPCFSGYEASVAYPAVGCETVTSVWLAQALLLPWPRFTFSICSTNFFHTWRYQDET